jgi:two-component sensor histidine kinase
LFSRDYLETKKHLSRLDKVLKISSILFFILGILLLYSYTPWNKVINNFVGIICILLIVISTIIYFKGHSKTKYYIFAMLLYFSFVILFTFMVNGTLEYSNLTRYGFLVASAIEVVIFSLILANRYNEIKENIQTILEIEVENRTNKLTQLLRERELLLKEVYHRVKNNFHVVIGMLWFESKKENSDTQNYKELINRIKSMSMIHEHLYNSKDLTNIDTKEYLSKIIYNISSSYHKYIISSKIEETLIEFDHAVSLGIVINEILTNSIKHNKNIPNFSIDINLIQKENIVFLTIKDNGIGFNNNKQTKGLGLKLVEQFCQKLPDSRHSLSSENGTKFELQFIKGK